MSQIHSNSGSVSHPSYLKLLECGELERRADALYAMLEKCSLCPRRCGVNRIKGEKGFCRTGAKAVLSSYGPHFGEERPLSGIRGSGTVFFAGCNLGCVFCQNYEISQGMAGYEVEPELLAFAFLSLQHDGCHNINLVTPTHVIPFILKGLILAAREGLSIPLVYNCGGYESLETIRLLHGVVDIYMPDFKYWDDKRGLQLSKAEGYRGIAQAAIKEMHRQVGDLLLDHKGVAFRGLIIRHLVLPGGTEDAFNIVKWVSSELSRDTYINIMDQYRPCYRAAEFPPIDRGITTLEFQTALEAARSAGLRRIDGVKR